MLIFSCSILTIIVEGCLIIIVGFLQTEAGEVGWAAQSLF
jgi:hypothetical protein